MTTNKRRITVPIDIERLNSLRSDVAWQALSLAKKAEIVIERGLESMEAEESAAPKQP